MFIQIPDNIFFIIFMLLSVISSFLIIHTSKIIYSILYLIFFFINIACLLLLLKIEFLSILIILVYISAITIFFLFIVMTVNIKIIGPNLNKTKKIIDKIYYITLVSFIFFFESFNFFSNNFELGLNLNFFNNMIQLPLSKYYSNSKFQFRMYFKDEDDYYFNTYLPQLREYVVENKFFDHLFPFPNQIQNIEMTLPVDFSSIYSDFEFHSVFYNLFLIELLTIGLILLISLIGIVVLASTNRGKYINKFNIKKNKIFLII